MTRVPPTPLGNAITAYLTSLSSSGYSAATITSRRAHLVQWAMWCDTRGITTLAQLTPALLEQYRASLAELSRANRRMLSWSTQALHITAVRMLCAWAVRMKRLAVNPAADLVPPRIPKRLPRAVLSASETERILAQPDTTTLLGLRDRAILEVLYSTGIRRFELVNLDLADLDASRGVLFIREGKGRKDRVVPIGARAIVWINQYLDRARPHLVRRTQHHARGDPSSAALFVSARGARIRPTRLTERLHRYVQRAGITKPGSVHIFRHTMATLMHEGGADIRDLQEILGHADLKTTEIYTHVSIERLKAVHARTHPAATSRSSSRAHTPAHFSLAAAVSTTAAEE